MTNRLSKETSPYLLQHSENPVDWFPWGQEALDLAHEVDKPILLSVGYAACHWCHVMAHESFEDPETAALMNNYFINIKVDREERPDIDRIYMSAVVAMTGQGGWPMTVALTPEGEPFFGGTYFPPSPRHGLPSFEQVLLSLADAWSNRREEVLKSAAGISDYLAKSMDIGRETAEIGPDVLQEAFTEIKQTFDERYGGFGSAPKFPQPMILEFLLRYHHLTGDSESLHMVGRTIELMAKGGIFDQLGGGFARYSTDKYWLAPHFEKMLYDNALLARLYLNAWKATRRPLFRRIAESTLDWMLAEMCHEDGGFYSSLDADSEGVEGKYYVWDISEIREVLGDDADLFAEVYGLSESGNWEGTNILHGPVEISDCDIGLDRLVQLITDSKEKLLKARQSRVRPGLDDKVLTSWNGLALAAFAEAGRDFGNDTYTAAAVKNAEFVFNNLRQSDGRLFRTWKHGHTGKINGFLEDYAFLADGLLALYQSTYDDRWFNWSQDLTDLMLTRFADAEGAGFFDTPDDHEQLVSRPRETQDNAIPSGNAAAVSVLMRLHLYTGKGDYWDSAIQALSSMRNLVTRYPLGFGHWLSTAAFVNGNPLEIAIAGEIESVETQKFLDILNSEYRPFIVSAVGEDSVSVPLMSGRMQVDGKATAYICRNFVCEMPVNSPLEFKERIERSSKVASDD